MSRHVEYKVVDRPFKQSRARKAYNSDRAHRGSYKPAQRRRVPEEVTWILGILLFAAFIYIITAVGYSL